MLGAIEGERGTAALDLKEVGLGPVEIGVTGYLTADAAGAAEPKASEIVVGEPIRVEVVAPAALGPIEAPTGEWVKGLRLAPNGAEPQVIESTLNRWARDAGLKEGQSYVLEAYFDVPAEDVYQFQVLSGGRMSVEVDSHEVGQASGGRWRLMPVPLAAGTHHVRVKGTYEASPPPDIRFGGPGASSLHADRFRCPVAAGEATDGAKPENPL